MRFTPLLAAAAGIALTACASQLPSTAKPPATTSPSTALYDWQGAARGQAISFQVVPDSELPGAAGRADYTRRDVQGSPSSFTCDIRIIQSVASAGTRPGASNSERRQLASVTYHEVGHCLDWVQLAYSHGGFQSEGSAFGTYFAAAPEGYAEAYAMAALASCGADLAVVSWPGVTPRPTSGSCLPDPASVKPDRMSSYLATRNDARISSLGLY